MIDRPFRCHPSIRQPAQNGLTGCRAFEIEPAVLRNLQACSPNSSRFHVLPSVNLRSRFHSQMPSLAEELIVSCTRTSRDSGPNGLPCPNHHPLAHLLPFEPPQNLIHPVPLFSCSQTDARSLPGLPTPEATSDPILPVRSGSLRDLRADQLGAVG